jgi:hypothetical protein
MRHLTRKWLISRNNKSREPFRRVLAHDGLKDIMNKLFFVQTIPILAGSLSPPTLSRCAGRFIAEHFNSRRPWWHDHYSDRR